MQRRVKRKDGRNEMRVKIGFNVFDEIVCDILNFLFIHTTRKLCSAMNNVCGILIKIHLLSDVSMNKTLQKISDTVSGENFLLVFRVTQSSVGFVCSSDLFLLKIMCFRA